MSAADGPPAPGDQATGDPGPGAALEAEVESLALDDAAGLEPADSSNGPDRPVAAAGPEAGAGPAEPEAQEGPTTPVRDDARQADAPGGAGHLQPPPDAAYTDPTPRTPQPLSPTMRPQAQAQPAEAAVAESPIDAGEAAAHAGKAKEEPGEPEADGGGDGDDDDSRSEIQSIMEQFEGHEGEGDGGEAAAEGPGSPALKHPQRLSSLNMPAIDTAAGAGGPWPDAVASPAGKAGSLRSLSFSQHQQGLLSPVEAARQSPLASPALNKALPPEPDPEPDLAFDFHRFLDQLKHRSADPVARFLRSFLTEFGKKQWMVHEQVKIVSDFLAFITSKMAACEVWRDVSDPEFDNAREGMEKLVMNRLYSQTFSPAIAPPPPPASPRKGKAARPRGQPGPGRRGQHQEDVERDGILAQKVRIYGWVRERHLDINPVGRSGQRFLALAQQELLKIRAYRAPRDKVICVLNCCKVIFGLLRNSKDGDTSADAFVPLLIYVILQANPEHLVSNLQYIFRFRNQEKLGGEAGYYLSSLMGAVQFIESLDRTSLTVGDDEFEKSVEAAVSAIAERDAPRSPVELAASASLAPSEKRDPEKAAASADRTPRASLDQRPLPPRPDGPAAQSVPGGAAQALEATGAGLLKTIQKPLNSIGRMFSEDAVTEQHRRSPSAEGAQRLSPAVFQTPRRSADGGSTVGDERVARGARRGSAQLQKQQLRAEDAAARQASAETAEAQRIQRAEHRDVVDTLAGMFPNLDRDVIDDVVRMKEGRVGSAVDACLALNA